MSFLKSLIEQGIAKPVSGSNIFQFDYAGVPPRKCEWALFNPNYGFEISIPLSLLQEHIDLILSRIEGVRYRWDDKLCVWHIEFGTEPMEKRYTGKEYCQIKQGKFVALAAASTAIEKFPHLIDNLDDDDYEPLDLRNLPPRWCRMELRVYTDIVKECWFIHLNRMTGDHNTYWNILTQVNSYFQENAIFLPRSSFLQLVEGVKYDNNDHIQRYLFDDMLVREFCTYMICN